MSSAGPSAGLVLTEEEEQAPLSGLPDSLAGLLDDGWGMPAVLDAGWATWSGSDGSAAQPAAIAAAAGATDDPDLLRRRAQNRAAMQRHRQRQRELRDQQQQQCEELTAQLEQARLENEAVASEHSALEAQHSLRDDWMQVLRLLGETQQAERASGGSPAPAIAAAAPAPPGDTIATSSGCGDASQAALQLAAWLEAAAGSSGQLAAAPGQYVPTLAPAIAACLRTSPGMLASVRALTPAQLVGLWDELLGRIAALLATVEATGCKASERQLTVLMIESCLFLDLVALLRPNHFKALIAARNMPPAPPGPEGGEAGAHSQLLDALATVRLTPGQRRCLIAEWRAFQARQAELSGAANAAAAGVAAAAAAQGAAAEAAPAASLAAQVERYLQLAERAGELEAAADAHWASLLAFSDASWYLLTPLQGARLLAACRPFYPDPILLARALEEAEAAAAGGGEGAVDDSQPPRALLEAASAVGEESGGSGDEAAAAARCWSEPASAHQGGGGGNSAVPSSQLLPTSLLNWTCAE